MNKNTLLIVMLLFLIFPSISIAANYHVRSGCIYNGNGMAWVCAEGAGGVGAYNVLPSILTRGDTYYIADGNYPSYTVDDDVSGTLVITIKKATGIDHGTVTGWDSSYGDGQAFFAAPFNILTSYITFDGVTGLGSNYGSYGFEVTKPDCVSIFSQFIPLSGTMSGTTTSLSETVLTDSSQSWTVNNLQSKYLKITHAGVIKYYVIRSNTATTLTVANCNTMSSDGFQVGDSYEIVRTNGIQLIGAPGIGYYALTMNDVTISHVALVNCGASYAAYPQVGIYSYPAAGTNMKITNNYFSDSSSNILTRNWSGDISDNYFNNNFSGCDWEPHGQQISPQGSNVNLYNNIFKDSTVYVLGIHLTGSTNWKVYNNIVIGGNNIDSIFGSADALLTDVVTSSYFHHNTMINVVVGGRGLVHIGNLSNPTNDKSFAYNNLFYNCSNVHFNNVGYPNNIVHTHNVYYSSTGNYDAEGGTAQVGTGDPFVDSAKYKLTLKNPTQPGKTLTSPFDIDRNGYIRGLDGSWDRGAYEFKRPSPPLEVH